MILGRLNRMPADRRRRLIQVAAIEFASAGYENASLNRIIERCGMSKSSFYYVLSSKIELFDFVVRELIDDVAADISVPNPEEFGGDNFWRHVEAFFAGLVSAAQRRNAFLLLGRMFYADAPAGAKTAVAGTWAAVRQWVADVLRVGRRCAAVRADLPEELQVHLVFGILQLFDEWTVARYEDFTPDDLRALSVAQLATIRRTLAP